LNRRNQSSLFKTQKLFFMRIEMDYHSTKEDILLPEYGRTIQGMLKYAKSIPEPRLRQKTVEAIIVLMQQINPTNRNVEDYREKLWSHAFKIAGYDLDVTPPPGITIRRDEDKIRPDKVVYPVATRNFRHYGHNVQMLIAKAIDMGEGSKKEGFVEVIASYMKLAYKTWNKEHYVSDDVVKDDLEIISEGQLGLHEGHSSLDTLAYSAKKEKDVRGGRGRKGSSRGGKETGGSSRSSGSKRGYGASGNNSSSTNSNNGGFKRGGRKK
jgi:Domain of unknown function (DUF4290)